MTGFVCKRLRSRNSLANMGKTVALFAMVLFFLVGCSFPFQTADGGGSNITDISSNLGFLEVSRQGFMGGSVLYNPKKPSTGQLAKGVTLAVRLGYVERNSINSEQSVFTDIPEKAHFGSLHISDISENSISFRVQLYDARGNSIGSKSCYLGLDESVDINNDGCPDLEYKKPIRKRIGFESAIYLNFLSSQETLNTAMFAVLPEQYSRGVYPSGIIGINPDGKFIVRKYEDDNNTRRSMIEGLQKGDFVLDSLDGKYQRVVNPISSRGARNVSDSELEDIEESSIQVSYLFTADEFIDNTPGALFNALPDSVSANFLHIDSPIERLNSVLAFDNLIPLVGAARETPIPDEIFHEVVAQFTLLTQDEKIQLNRVFLEETYPELCPQMIEESVCFTEILPLASLLFGDDTENATLYDDLESRAASSSEYEAQRAALEEEFKTYKEFHRTTLSTTDIPKLGDAISVNLNNTYFALGIRGSFSSSWGSVSSKVEGAIFINADTNLNANISISKDLFKYTFPSFSKSIIIWGPIILNLKANITFNVPLNVTIPVSTSFQMRAAVTGVYGAGIDVGLNYGITWKKKWFIHYPAPYADFRGNTWAHNKTIYYVGSDSKNSATFHGITASITPNINASFDANITEVVHAGISANTGLRTSIAIDYQKPVLTGTAGLNGTLYLGANAFIGLKTGVPLLGSLGKGWDWTILNYDKSIASWPVFKTTL